MKIELNDAERQNLIVLLDLAIKAGGMNAAKAALPIIEKLEATAEAAINE